VARRPLSVAAARRYAGAMSGWSGGNVRHALGVLKQGANPAAERATGLAKRQ